MYDQPEQPEWPAYIVLIPLLWLPQPLHSHVKNHYPPKFIISIRRTCAVRCCPARHSAVFVRDISKGIWLGRLYPHPDIMYCFLFTILLESGYTHLELSSYLCIITLFFFLIESQRKYPSIVFSLRRPRNYQAEYEKK